MLSTQHVVIVIPKRTPDCPEPRAFQKNFARQIAQNRELSKKILYKKTQRNTHDESKR